jgi:hypothetical protein
MDLYENAPLWKNAFDPRYDGFEKPRSILLVAYQEFRNRVALLLQQIQKELPLLTLHDITHVDSLWRIASEISGPDFDLNPAEAFVLGGAFLLHDAAHCRAAFPGGLAELQQTAEWRDSAAQRGIALDTLTEGSEAFQIVLFDTLRVLHPEQAKKLPFAQWPSGAGKDCLYLLAHDELRGGYGHIIGEIAASHWWHPQQLESIAHRNPAAPVCLAPANWTVDMLKVALLLRTADAAHIDARRAPRFLMAINQPQGVSKKHWRFQARLHQPKCDLERGELVISGNPFPEKELSAWWLAYDSACLANRELAAADLLMKDNNRPKRLAARSVAGTHSPEAFAQHVPTDGWYPVDTAIKITDIKSVVERFGGEKLYGNDPSAALRELLQNAVDAVHACRSLGGLGVNEGEIEILLEDTSGGHWLHVTDNGIGMSRYVLTEVLLNFGRSLWRSADLRGEWSGLSSSDFEAIGQFGIGFFSVFMLGVQVRVITRRYEPKDGEASQWLLNFSDGTNKRPTLRAPVGEERLKKHGTRVSVLISQEKLSALCNEQNKWPLGEDSSFVQACARLAPAIDMNLYVKNSGEDRLLAVQANDWMTLPSIDLLRRIAPGYLESTSANRFGPWTHLSELYDNAGRIIGRCAVQPSSWGPNYGIGVVKGLLAGNVDGIAGIIISKKQNDLARREAVPDISLASVRKWAEEQKDLLLKNEKLSGVHSALLASFGVSHTALTLGKFGKQAVSFEELIDFMIKLDEVIVHSGKITYDENEDRDVRPADFENDFDIIENLLELPKLLNQPKWLHQINGDNISCASWSLDSALEAALVAAWEQVDWDEESVTVGYVNGDEISRTCRVARRLVEE